MKIEEALGDPSDSDEIVALALRSWHMSWHITMSTSLGVPTYVTVNELLWCFRVINSTQSCVPVPCKMSQVALLTEILATVLSIFHFRRLDLQFYGPNWDAM